ncbi:MAG TPA: metal ABC transporter ATP-binding protein [Acidimicrobiales bacterium]|nr:metal ABC transporter ATP-binding protein [Acidimicrobiales bacterium]
MGCEPLPEDRREVVHVHRVSVSLGGRTVLRDVDFRVGEGEFVGLIGTNGSGKTTLLRAILGLQAIAAGEVLVAGRARRRGGPVGYVPQRVAFDHDVPVRVADFVALGVDGTRLGLARRGRGVRARVDEVLASLELSALAGRRIGALSGGEQQRVLMAHALASRPRLLLLDEPLANLDLPRVHETIAVLDRVRRAEGVAVVLSAHEIGPLVPVMDRVIYVAQGAVACGTTEEVVRPEVLSALYGHHVDVLHVHGRVVVVEGEAGDPGAHPEVVVR